MHQQKRDKTILTFAVASFLNDLGSDMIYPVWPIFITTVLHANVTVLGFLDGLGESLVSLSQGISGYLSDRLRKRKFFIWLGYLCACLARFGYACAPAWQIMVPFRILDRVGKIRGAPRDAMVADVSPPEDRGKSFGFLRAMDNLGALCGALVCILLLGIVGYRKLFLLAALPSLGSALLVLTAIREKRVNGVHIYKGISLREVNKDISLLLVSSSLFTLGAFSYSFLLLYAHESGFQVTALPILYLLFTTVASLMSFPMGKLSDRIGRRKVIIMSYLLWGVVCASFIAGKGYLSVIAAFIIYGAHRGALEPGQRAFVSELAPVEHKASVLGGFQMVMGLCALPASLLAGLIWDAFGRFVPLYCSLVLTALSVILLFFVKESRKSGISTRGEVK